MNRHIFSKEEIKTLTKNPCVLECTRTSIIYTYEFKKRALELYAQGESSRGIWQRAGFDISGWKKDYTRYCLKNWRRIMRKKGLEGLKVLRGSKGGRLKTKGLTNEDKIKHLELQVKYLKAENDFLAKLRAMRAESNSRPVRNSKSSNK